MSGAGTRASPAGRRKTAVIDVPAGVRLGFAG